MGVALVLGGWLAASAVVSVAVGAVVARADTAPRAQPTQQPPLAAGPADRGLTDPHLVSAP